MESSRGTRGRPVKPIPAVQRKDGWIGCEDRIGWLLRINRLYGEDEKLAVGAVFARAFRGGCSPRSVSPAQVTRWERVSQRADHAVLRRYEQLLGLPGSRLVAVADLVYRQTRGVPGRSFLDSGAGADSRRLRERTGQLLDQALGSDPMGGQDWDELTTSLSALPAVLLHPRHAWASLAERLLSEMIISGDMGWLQRTESLHRLLGHPSGELPVIGACAAMAADPTCQVSIEPLGLLEVSPHPEAARQLLRQIASPASEHAFRGAWWSVAEKIGRSGSGHFTQVQLQALSQHAVTLLSSGAQHPGCRLAAAELLRQARQAEPDGTGIASALRRITATDQVTHHILRTGRIAAAETAAAVVNRVAAASISRLPRDALDEDPTFRQLLETMLFDPLISHRVVAAYLIQATPYRQPVAAALTTELRSRQVLDDPSLASAIAVAVTTLGGLDSRRLAERLVLAAAVPVAVAEAATWALGNVPGGSDDQFWSAALARCLGGGSPLDLSAARGLVYALGMSRNMPLLRGLQANHTVPEPVLTAARWWLNIPGHILRSTARLPER